MRVALVLRRTVRHGDRLVEAFVHTVASLEEFVEREIATRRRSSLLHMCAEGRLLVDTDGLGTALQLRCRLRLEAGPPPLSAVEDEDRRYGITDLLDDLAGCTDPAELVFVAGAALQALAELILLRDRQWTSSGKWLLRRVRAWAPELADLLVDGYRRSVVNADPGPFCAVAADVLERYGGRVQEGMNEWRRDDRPSKRASVRWRISRLSRVRCRHASAADRARPAALHADSPVSTS